MKKMKRREMLAVGSGALGLGIGTLLGFGLSNGKAEATNVPVSDADLWRYARIDPLKAADLSYEIYPNGACMYAAVRALLTTIADSLRDRDPASASVVMGFPFHMMRYGAGGVGATGSICGAFNGCAAVIGMFIKDTTKQNEMIQELAIYCEEAALPKYKPKDDRFPTMKSSIAGSTLCHISSARWGAVAETSMASPERRDRCRRLTSDIVVKTAELLNRYFADRNATFAPLMEPTATCFTCHGAQGQQANIIGTARCAACHEQGERHIERMLNQNR